MPREAGSFPQARASAAFEPAAARKAARASARLKLRPEMVVFDVVPKPAVTPLLAEAARIGCRFGGGRLMIDCQADAVLEFLGFA